VNCYTPEVVVKADSDAVVDDLPQATATTVRNAGDDEDMDYDNRSSNTGTSRRRATHGLRACRFQSPGLVEWGHTKVLCQVRGPTTNVIMNTSSDAALSMEQGTLRVHVRSLASISASTAASTSSFSSSQIMTMEKELATQITTALYAAIPLEAFPKHCLQLLVHILQDDGGVLPACIVAATYALCNTDNTTPIPMYDLVTACTVVIVQWNQNDDNKSATTPESQAQPPQIQVWADPTKDELQQSCVLAIITLAWMPAWKHVTLWEQQTTTVTTTLSPTTINQALSLCRDGCRTLHKLLQTALLDQAQQQQQQQH
jgi:ribonuclease PH